LLNRIMNIVNLSYLCSSRLKDAFAQMSLMLLRREHFACCSAYSYHK
jgi:hypothetical protein